MEFGDFEREIYEFAKTFQYSIALPESRDPRMLAAAYYLLETRSVAKIFLFLSEAELRNLSRKAGLNLERYRPQIIAVTDDLPDIANKTSNHIIRLGAERKKKITANEVLTFSKNPIYQAGYLTAEGAAHLALAGASSTTAEVIRAGLRTIPLLPGLSSISSSFLLVREEQGAPQVLLFADCGVNVEPTSIQLADIAESSCQTWNKLRGEGDRAVVGFLSFSTKGSARHRRIDTITEGVNIFRQRCPQILADGELQFDAAFDREVGLRKCPGSPVAGRANIFIFPNLEAGNIAYKIAQRLGKFSAYGPLLQGFSRPYHDLSRGCTVKDIVMSTYLSIILAS